MILQAMCTSFKVELFGGVHDLDTDTIKMALYTSDASLSADTTVYTTANETTGINYVAGGKVLTSPIITSSGSTAYVDFADVTWTGATFTTRGALIYNASKSNKAIAVLDFGANKTVSGTDFVVQMPVANASNALLRIG